MYITLQDDEMLSISQVRQKGTLYTFGNNEDGQLGIEAGKRKFPAIVTALENLMFTQVATGGMHTVALTDDGRVYTFGCNDAGALGRESEVTEDGKGGQEPAEVKFPEAVVQIAAGACYSAALTKSGKVYIWGSFRDSAGYIGLLPREEGTQVNPLLVKFATSEGGTEPNIVKLAGGSNHMITIASDGSLYSWGDGNVGQLGRYVSTRNLRSNAAISRQDVFLTPRKLSDVRMKKVIDIWAGGSVTFCKTGKDEIWAFGLNTNSQFGCPSKKPKNAEDLVDDANLNTHSIPMKVSSFNSEKPWKQFTAGLHHSFALNEQGHVFSFGNPLDGRLGLGEIGKAQVSNPTRVRGPLENEKCVQIACGDTTSYAVTDEGKLYAWGYGDNWQLAYGEDDDRNLPILCKSSRNDEGINGKVVYISGGSQHVAVIIAKT